MVPIFYSALKQPSEVASKDKKEIYIKDSCKENPFSEDKSIVQRKINEYRTL